MLSRLNCSLASCSGLPSPAGFSVGIKWNYGARYLDSDNVVFRNIMSSESSAVSAEPDSTSSATDDAAAAVKQEQTNAAAAPEQQEEENAADSGETGEGAKEDEKPTKVEDDAEAEAEAKEAPQDKGAMAEPEQPAAQADCSNGDSSEAKPGAAATAKASPLQEKIIRQVEVSLQLT